MNKWKTWNVNHWVLETPKGEVVDEIVRDDNDLFVLKSNKAKYTSLKAAQNAGKENRSATQSPGP
jgi:hypothetical protein